MALWLPALLGIVAICTESSRGMGSDHTIIWVQRLCSLTHIKHLDLPGMNYALRKCGHLFGYGALGILFTRIWLAISLKWFRNTGVQLRVISAAYGVITTAVTAGLDEFHQSFLPNRSSSVDDVVLDTLGAVLLISAWLCLQLLDQRSARVRRVWPENHQRRNADAQSLRPVISHTAKIDGPLFTNASSLVLEG